MPPFQLLSIHARRTFLSVSSLTRREKQRLLAEVQQARGLMAILMKQRNG